MMSPERRTSQYIMAMLFVLMTTACVLRGVPGEPCVSLYVGILYWPLQSAALTSALSIAYIRCCVRFLLESALTTVVLTLVVIPFSKIGLSVGSRVIVVKELLSQSYQLIP